jgi:hypothetical protein
MEVFLFAKLGTYNWLVALRYLERVYVMLLDLLMSNYLQTTSATGTANLGFMSPRIASPMHPSGGGRGAGGGGRGRGRGGFGGGNVRRDRELIGQTIKITGGPYKGTYLYSHTKVNCIILMTHSS